MKYNDLQSFKQNIKILNESYWGKSQDSWDIWEKRHLDMLKDVELYYEKIQSIQDAIILLQNSITAFEINKNIKMNESHASHWAMLYSIFVKFFTVNDYCCFMNFIKMLYNKRKNALTEHSRRVNLLRKEKCEVLMKMLKVCC